MVDGRCVIILRGTWRHLYRTTIISEHPGTSRAVPNALTVTLISHVDKRCRRRTRVKQTEEASSASEFRPRPPAKRSFPYLLGTLLTGASARAPRGPWDHAEPDLSVQSGRRRAAKLLAKQAFSSAEYFPCGTKSPGGGRGSRGVARGKG